jgi:hypothetical protein
MVVAFPKRTRAANNMVLLLNICACALQDNVVTLRNCRGHAMYSRHHCLRRLYSNSCVVINIKLLYRPFSVGLGKVT